MLNDGIFTKKIIKRDKLIILRLVRWLLYLYLFQDTKK